MTKDEQRQFEELKRRVEDLEKRPPQIFIPFPYQQPVYVNPPWHQQPWYRQVPWYQPTWVCNTGIASGGLTTQTVTNIGIAS